MAEDDEQRTYGIWGFAAVFVVIVAVGIWAVLSFGTYDREPTTVLPSVTATSSPEATSTTLPVPVTLLDGTEAPEEVEDVVHEPGQHTYVFRLPEEWEGEPTDSAVPPSLVELSEDERRLTIRMGCAVSEASVPDAIRVTEDPFEINVTPVVTGPSFGAQCPEGTLAGTFTLAFEEPLGTRRLVIAPAGANVQFGPLR